MGVLRGVVGVSAVVLLAGCGGGGGVASTPPPVDPPSPSYTSFNALSTDQQLAMRGTIETSYTDRSGGRAEPTTSVLAALTPSFDRNLNIAYNAATNSYTIKNGARSQEFAPGDINPELAYLGPAFTMYQKGTISSDVVSYFGLLKPSGDQTHVALTYTTVANWVERRTTTDPNDPRLYTTKTIWAVGGFETVASDMPRRGSASYSAFFHGNQRDGSFLSGDARLQADFETGRVDASLYLNRPSISTIIVNGVGAIESGKNSFGGQFDSSGFRGSFDGAFFGPKAAEMGFSFSIRNADGVVIDGVAAGKHF